MEKVDLYPPLSATQLKDTTAPRVTQPPAAQKVNKARSPKALNFGLGLAGIATLAVLFETVPRMGIVSQAYLPPFSTVLEVMVVELLPSSAFWESLLNTLVTFFSGLLIVTVSGAIMGALIGGFPRLRALSVTTIEFLRPIPSVAFIPLAIAVFGIDRGATLTLVIYAAFWQIFMQVQYGIRDVDPVARDTTRVYRFGPGTVARQLIWPTVLPYAMTGFRLAASVALILTVTGELIIGSPGIGNLIVASQTAANFAQMYGLIIVAGLLGLLVNMVTRAIERRLLHWHPSVRLEASA